MTFADRGSSVLWWFMVLSEERLTFLAWTFAPSRGHHRFDIYFLTQMRSGPWRLPRLRRAAGAPLFWRASRRWASQTSQQASLAWLPRCAAVAGPRGGAVAPSWRHRRQSLAHDRRLFPGTAALMMPSRYGGGPLRVDSIRRLSAGAGPCLLYRKVLFSDSLPFRLLRSTLGVYTFILLPRGGAPE